MLICTLFQHWGRFGMTTVITNNTRIAQSIFFIGESLLISLFAICLICIMKQSPMHANEAKLVNNNPPISNSSIFRNANSCPITYKWKINYCLNFRIILPGFKQTFNNFILTKVILLLIKEKKKKPQTIDQNEQKQRCQQICKLCDH